MNDAESNQTQDSKEQNSEQTEQKKEKMFGEEKQSANDSRPSRRRSSLVFWIQRPAPQLDMPCYRLWHVSSIKVGMLRVLGGDPGWCLFPWISMWYCMNIIIWCLLYIAGWFMVFHVVVHEVVCCFVFWSRDVTKGKPGALWDGSVYVFNRRFIFGPLQDLFMCFCSKRLSYVLRVNRVGCPLGFVVIFSSLMLNRLVYSWRIFWASYQC